MEAFTFFAKHFSYLSTSATYIDNVHNSHMDNIIMSNKDEFK